MKLYWKTLCETILVVSLICMGGVSQAGTSAPTYGYLYGSEYVGNASSLSKACGDSASPHVGSFVGLTSGSETHVAVLCENLDSEGEVVEGNQVFNFYRVRICRSGYLNAATLLCVTDDAPKKKPGCPRARDGNPIDTLYGYKTQHEVDFDSSQSTPLIFTRSYNSNSLDQTFALGAHWRHPYEWRLDVVREFPEFSELPDVVRDCGDDYVRYVYDSVRSRFEAVGSCSPYDLATDIQSVYVVSPDGSEISFNKVGVDYVADTDVKSSLTELTDNGSLVGWQFTTPDNMYYSFNMQGQLTKITDLHGNEQQLEYDLTVAQGGDDNDRSLDKITDQNGKTLEFDYVDDSAAVFDGQLASIEDPDGNVYRYDYSAEGLLKYVSVPDQTPGVTGSNPFGEDNPVREYHYEDQVQPTLLTGISDERGVRYANWSYDSSGRAISSHHGELADTIDTHTFDYGFIDWPSDRKVTVTNPLGKAKTYHYQLIEGARRLVWVEGQQHANQNDPSIGCEAASQFYQYDSNGFLEFEVDWEGNVTQYVHDSKGRETSRTEGMTAAVTPGNPPVIGTPSTIAGVSRTITTEWHPKFRLPTRITEPDKVVDMSYNCDSGRLESRKEWTPAAAPAYSAPVCS